MPATIFQPSKDGAFDQCRGSRGVDCDSNQTKRNWTVRYLPSEAEGHRFESCRVRHLTARTRSNRPAIVPFPAHHVPRSEERRVGKECVITFRSRGDRYHLKKK